MRRRVAVRWLIVAACLVVLVDVGAGVLTLISTQRTNRARSQVTAGESYEANSSAMLQAMLEAETAVRGYMLTGDLSYLTPLRTELASAPATFKAIHRASRGDPRLRRDFTKLVALLNARTKELKQTYELTKKGHQAAAIAIVKTNRGNQLTQQITMLIEAMNKRSAGLVSRARSSARASQLWANRSAIGAYIASGLLLLVMVTLIREYVLTESARRDSRLAQLEAERLNRAKAGFLSRVSHELRTPLNAILGFGQLLERDLIEPGERDTLEQMLTAGRHLVAIVDDLLDLSRIEAGELRLSLEPVQVAEALAEAKAMTSHVATTAAVGIRQRPADAELYVRADRQRLLQVLLNLLSNAVKYNRRGGNVVITAGVTADGNVRIGVEDTGIGIPSESLDKLFTPFERLDAASRGIDGTGLGLAVARGLVESMGGRLDISSKEGIGTRVWLELPISSSAEVTAPRRRQRTPEAMLAAELAEQKLRPAISVLYIEDNPSNVRLVEKIFALSSDLGLDVARDGTSGLSLARELRPDLILLDLHLPDMSGEQVLTALRTDEELAATPVIIVSADATPAQAKRLRAAGAVGYLTKPFDVDQLLSAVRSGGTAPIVADADGNGDGLLDASMVGSLHMLAANQAVGPGQIGEMLATFRYDADGMLRNVHEAIAEGNLAAVAREAHRLAGGAGAVGAGRLRVLCKELEQKAGAGRMDQAREADAKLDELLDQTWDALAREFGEELRDVQPLAE